MKKAITINVREYRKAIKNGKPRETGNIGYTRRIQYNTIQYNTIFVGHHYGQANTINVNKTRSLLQTTGGKNEPNIVFMPTS